MFLTITMSSRSVFAQDEGVGSIRGVVFDADFDAPLALAKVLLLETGQSTETTDQGTYLLSDVAPGTFTVIFSKDGYVRKIRSGVVVTTNSLTDVDISLAGDFTDMEEFIVQDLRLGAGSESALLNLRFKSPALMDSIGADLMSRAGAGDAAGALKLVTGASVEDGKFAVIRGLPDRYVSSQMNGVRLPTADEDKRAVQLDQFPAAVIESLQVSKTFTPDQQGDASGGAVDVRLKNVPDETIFKISTQVSYNSQVTGRDDFLTYKGGGVSSFGQDDGGRDIQFENIGQHWDGAVGTSREDAPIDWKMTLAAGGKHELGNGVKVGAFGSFFYERDSSFYDNGRSDSYWVEPVNGPELVPETVQGTSTDGSFKTRLFDVTRGVQSVQWGTLSTLGLETDNHSLGLTYLYTRAADDSASLSEDTRGKAFFFPGYDPDDPNGIGNGPFELDTAPYLRLQTLEYTERSTQTIQLNGSHVAPMSFDIGVFEFRDPKLEWTYALSSADLKQPDKRQFGSLFRPASNDPGIPPFIPPSTTDPGYTEFKPAANFTAGNLQRTFKEIEEESAQYFADLTLPFDQWSSDEGYLKAGLFVDDLERDYDQESFSNLGETGLSFSPATFDQFWTDAWPGENHPLFDPLTDVDYRGKQELFALYSMIDLPLNEELKLIGGARFESTKIGIVNVPEANSKYFPPGSLTEVDLTPGVTDVDYEQRDILPMLGVSYSPSDEVTFRGSYSQTVARQTFKELTPIIQQEFLGGPIFIGNPDLQMSALDNFDLRMDYTPYEGALVSVSAFKKNVENPIELVQRSVLFSYSTPVNFPSGELKGIEVEVRQKLGNFWESLTGMSVGANATFIDSVVNLPASEVDDFATIGFEVKDRPMTNAPEHIYNAYINYDYGRTMFTLFYSVQGDTLVVGAGQSIGKNFVPDVYQEEFGTLNFSASHRFGKNIDVKFQAKNLTNPEIREVYRGGFPGDDVTKTSYTKGIEFSISLGFQL